MSQNPTSLQQEKQRLRERMRALRQANTKNNSYIFNKLSAVFLHDVQLEENAIISNYRAFRDEMDPAILAEALRAQGHKIALPVVTAKGEPLGFRLYKPGDRLITNAMGIAEPDIDAPLVDPDVLLVPLLAFDRMHNRLGYGGGYYDRTIAGLRARKRILAIGVAYACQEIPAVPTGPNDARLDRVVTELNVF